VCPENAVTEESHTLGKVRIGSFKKSRRFVDGFLNIGQLRSAEVICKVVEEISDENLVILDAPPGTSCAAVAATCKVDLAVLVTEPTPFGLHDLKLAHIMLNRLGVPHAVVINRADLGDEKVALYCESEGLSVLSRIPFDRRIAELYAEGKLISEYPEYRKTFVDLAEKITERSNFSVSAEIEENTGELDREISIQPGKNSSRSLVVLSGKGGTGKTMVAACLSASWKDKAAADADVDAANLGILLEGEVIGEIPFSSGNEACISPELCSGCGECLSCHFSAISINEGKAVVEALKCEGCGLCAEVCLLDAVALKRPRSGHITVQSTPYSPLVSAQLVPGAEASGRLVTQVRQHTESLVSRENISNILIDGSPGVGCPVNAALTGSDGVLLVAEPSRSSLHDLERLTGLLDFFNLPRWVVINKHDLSAVLTEEIERFCNSKDIEVIGRIPFDRTITESIVRAQIPSQDLKCTSARLLEGLSKRIVSKFERKP